MTDHIDTSDGTRAARVTVFHGYYGCDTGCCGHYVVLQRPGRAGQERFIFEHPYSEDEREFVRAAVTEQFGAEHVADIDWDNVVVSDD